MVEERKSDVMDGELMDEEMMGGLNLYLWRSNVIRMKYMYVCRFADVADGNDDQ